MVLDQGRSGQGQSGCLMPSFSQFRPDVQEIQAGTSVAAFCAFAKDVVGALPITYLCMLDDAKELILILISKFCSFSR